MAKDDEELLRLVREWRPSDTLHPIAMQAWNFYESDGHSLSEQTIEHIKRILDSNADDLASLGHALEGLSRFSILLSDYQNDSDSAEKIVVVMREYAPRFEPLWERVVEAIANVTPPTEHAHSAGVTADVAAETMPEAQHQ